MFYSQLIYSFFAITRTFFFLEKLVSVTVLKLCQFCGYNDDWEPLLRYYRCKNGLIPHPD